VRVVRLPGPFARAAVAADVPSAKPYTLRHSFCSLLLHEGRSVIYVARQLGHDAKLTLSTYGHVIDELEDAPRVPAEEAIRAARRGPCLTGVDGRRRRDACGPA
jgi:integrase